MKLDSISTYALSNNLRLNTANLQRELIDAQKEAVTGRYADIGKKYGYFTSSVVTLERQVQYISQIEITNSFAENRLSTMQVAMGSMIESANNFIGQLTAELNGSLDKSLLQTIGQSALEELTSAVNTTINGEYVFSGINTDNAALVDYQSASGAPAITAVQDAFTTAFGFWAGDPAAQSITPAALKAFIDGPFMDLFNDTNWQSMWSGASERGMRSKISTRELVETPTTANAEAFRKITAASVLINEFANGQLKPSTIDQLTNSALQLMAENVIELGAEQAKIGTVEKRIQNANDRMEYQKSILDQQLASLTDVDSYEAATRLNQIVVSLEASYAVTARIQSLSILNYL